MPVLCIPYKNDKSNALLIEYNSNDIAGFRAFIIYSNTLYPLTLDEYSQKGLVHTKKSKNAAGFKITLINSNSSKVPGVLLSKIEIQDTKAVETTIALEKRSWQNTGESIEESIKGFLKANFLQMHDAQLQEDRNRFFSLFSCFRSTKVQASWTLDEIVKHALSDNNRSRQVLAKMGLINKEGESIGLLKSLNLELGDKREPDLLTSFKGFQDLVAALLFK